MGEIVTKNQWEIVTPSLWELSREGGPFWNNDRLALFPPRALLIKFTPHQEKSVQLSFVVFFFNLLKVFC